MYKQDKNGSLCIPKVLESYFRQQHIKTQELPTLKKITKLTRRQIDIMQKQLSVSVFFYYYIHNYLRKKSTIILYSLCFVQIQ